MTHETSVDWVPNNHGYPFRATCTCGWQSLGYVARHAADAMAEDHLAAYEPVDEPHTGHYSLFGTYWCDTCDSHYCELA